MTVAEFLHGIATSAGLDSDNPAIKLMLSDINLTNSTVPSEFETLVTSKYKDMITIEAAKNHPDLKRHFMATALYGVDKDILRIAEKDYGFSEEELSELKKIEKTQDRMNRFAAMTRDKFEKKAAPSDEEKHKKLQDTIKALNESIVKDKETFEQEKKNIKQGYINTLLDRTKKSLFQKYQYTDAIPQKAQISTAQTLLDDDLAEKNYKLVFNEENDRLKLLTSEDTEVFIDNKPVDVDQYVERLLAENKLLKVTPAKPAPGQREPIILQPLNNGKQPVNNSAFLAAVEQSAQDVARS